LRDEASKVLEKNARSKAAIKERFIAFNNQAAQRIADFFQVLVSDPSINCAVRLSVDGKEKSYVTVGRSSGMDSTRETHTEPIPASRGLPAKLTSAKYSGVFLINDIQKAIETGDYLELPNDRLPDCNSAIIGPINGWSDGNKEMVGILSVFSRDKGRFEQWHTTSFKAVVDILGLAYPMMLTRIATLKPKQNQDKRQ
jgi:hypothetical protein